MSNITDLDQFLFHQGTHYESYRFLGSHYNEVNEETTFTVWAPHAKRVFVALDVNNWTGDGYELMRIKDSGLYTGTFNVPLNTTYKYRILSDHKDELKADPYAVYAEVRPHTASIVYKSHYEWTNDYKPTYNEQMPMNIYEVHLGTWMKHHVDRGDMNIDDYTNHTFLTYRELADQLVPYVKEMGYTHVELMPIMEHPFDLSWGYQVTGYFAPTSRFGTPDDFKYLIDQFHSANIGVILDWVPAHFCKDAHGLIQFDGGNLFEHPDTYIAEKRGWGTLAFDYGRPEVQSFLISNALYWLTEYKVDGLRVDAVHSMTDLNFENHLPHEQIFNEHGTSDHLAAIAFLQKLNQVVFEYYPNALMMAEDSSDVPNVTHPISRGGLGFNYKWDLGYMHDMLTYFKYVEHERSYHHHHLTFPLVYRYTERFILPFSHDEVVHGKLSMLDKMPGDQWQKFANLRLLFGLQMAFPGKMLNFMGSEIGMYAEWKDKEQIDWFLLDYPVHSNFKSYVKTLNHFYQSRSELFELDYDPKGFNWIDVENKEHEVISFERTNKESDTLICAFNMTATVIYNFRLGVNKQGTYKEIFNSDLTEFGGSNQVVEANLFSEDVATERTAYSIQTKLPPFGMVIYQIKE